LDGVIFLTNFISTFVFYYYLVYLIIRIPRKFHRIKGEERSVKIIKYPFDILYLFEFLVTISNSTFVFYYYLVYLIISST
jgi:hypothetical protein